MPPPQRRRPVAGGPGLLGAWVQAEKMIQIALVLPCAGFIGWVAGLGLDHWLHQTWISMVGIVFGIISGLVGAIKLTLVYSGGPDAGSTEDEDSEKGNSDTNP